MRLIFGYIKYELLPEYSEKSQLTNLFLENKFWGWTGLLSIFLLVSAVLYFQLKIWDNEDKLANKKRNEWKEKQLKQIKKSNKP